MLLMTSAYRVWIVRAHQTGMEPGLLVARLPQLATFALAVPLALGGVGAYGVGSFPTANDTW